MILKVQNVACGYGETSILRNIDLEVGPGEILCILGPNGTGKTTFFKTILGFLTLLEGRIELDFWELDKCKRKDLAQKIGYVPQAHDVPYPYRVLDFVVMGRSAHMGLFSSPKKTDYAVAEQSLATLNVLYLRDKICTQISGGERQMVMIARALTQETPILVMDEPTSNLDFGNQVKVLTHINNLAQKNKSIIMTSHYPNHAFLCSSKVALMQEGTLVAYGEANDIATEDRLSTLYGIPIKLLDYKLNGSRLRTCVPVL